MNTIILKATITLALSAILFSGCSNQEVMMAQSVANGAVATQGTANYFNASLNQVGVLQGQAAGYSTFANPMALGTIAAAGALSAQRAAENKKSYKKLNTMMANQNVSNDIVKSYNKKYGTNYRSMAELQNAKKI